MTNERCYQTDRGVGSDLAISLESDPEEIMQDVYYEDDDIDDQEKRRIAEEEMEEEEPLTPPRASNINIAPDPTPPLDLNLWRRLYPPTPPSSSCSESLISLAAGIFHESSSTSTSTTTDATGISSSLATISSTSSSSTVFTYSFDRRPVCLCDIVVDLVLLVKTTFISESVSNLF